MCDAQVVSFKLPQAKINQINLAVSEYGLFSRSDLIRQAVDLVLEHPDLIDPAKRRLFFEMITKNQHQIIEQQKLIIALLKTKSLEALAVLPTS